MPSTRVAFPMYVLPKPRAAMALLWHGVKARLEAQRWEHLPPEPEFDDPLAERSIPQPPLLVQHCGYPYLTGWGKAGLLRPLACFDYAFPGCADFMHSSFILVRKNSDIHHPSQLAGKTAAINSRDSNTGMNLPRLFFTPYAKQGKFFARVIETGAHMESLKYLVAEKADMAVMDCITYAHARQHHPELTEKVKMLAETAKSPTLPLFVPEALSESQCGQMISAFKAVIEAQKPSLACIGICGIRPITEETLGIIAAYEQQVIASGYPELA